LEDVGKNVKLNGTAPHADRRAIGLNRESFAFTRGGLANHLDPVENLELQNERLLFNVGFDHIVELASDPIHFVNRIHDNS
jgi:hypothetical protein